MAFNPLSEIHYNSKYRDLELTDEVAYNFASHGMTSKEIAEMFKIDKGTFLNNFGTAFRAGKADWHIKPTKFLRRIVDAFDDNLTDEQLLDKDIPLDRAIRACQGLASMQQKQGLAEVAERLDAFDCVDTTPEIIERPADDKAD